jgi:hypothetical protein
LDPAAAYQSDPVFEVLNASGRRMLLTIFIRGPCGSAWDAAGPVDLIATSARQDADEVSLEAKLLDLLGCHPRYPR